MIIDGLQYIRPSRAVFEQMRHGRVDAVHITVAYHEGLLGVIDNLAAWNVLFQAHSDLIYRATSTDDIAADPNRTAIFFGLQTPGPLETDLRRVEILHQLGVRVMQVTYNQQSALGAGCYEPVDSGLTAFGRNVVAEANRLGLLLDLSHAGERTALDVIEASTRPVTISHANPKTFADIPRNLSDKLLDTLFAAGGFLGLSLYPLHLKDNSDCRITDFAQMVAELVDRYGPDRIGIGSDLCQGQPDEVVAWMRDGTWRPRQPATFPDPVAWFKDNQDFAQVAQGLAACLPEQTVKGILGDNWLAFLQSAWRPA